MLQSWYFAVGIVGGLIAAALALVQSFMNLRQRKQEYRWRQALTAKDLVDDMYDDQDAYCGLLMIDGLLRSVELPDGSFAPVGPDEIPGLLNPDTETTDERTLYIHRCVDTMFHHLHRIGHFVGIGLVQFEDIAPPLEYYVRLLAEHRNYYSPYIAAIGYGDLLEVLGSFDAWRDAAS
jgi:hypothetical protein